MRQVGGERVRTTVGRALLFEICPDGIAFEKVNRVMGKKQLAELIDESYRECGQKATVLLADHLRTMGFTYATQAGISICIDDMKIPDKKNEMIDDARKEVAGQQPAWVPQLALHPPTRCGSRCCPSTGP